MKNKVKDLSKKASLDKRSISIRKANQQDMGQIFQLIKSIEVFTFEEKKTARELVQESCTQKVSGYKILVAVSNKEIIGYLCYGKTPLTKMSYDLYWLAVSPLHQKQGVARGLISYLITQLSKKDHSLLRAETSGKKQYTATRKFYEKYGFKLAGHIKNFYSKKDDLYTYVYYT